MSCDNIEYGHMIGEENGFKLFRKLKWLSNLLYVVCIFEILEWSILFKGSKL